MCFSKTFPSKPIDVIYLGLLFIQKWRVLKKKHARIKIEAMVTVVGEHMKKFRPSEESITDVSSL
jgi:hypothetical protein